MWKICAFLMGILASSGLQAKVFDSIHYTYYTVDGSADSKLSLKQRLDKATPIKRNGIVLHGDTRWSISWKLITDNTEKGLCKVNKPQVYINALIQLPEMDSDSDALQQRFNRYVKALQKHHIAHYIIGVQAANKIDLRLSQLKAQKNCQTLNAQAEKIANHLLKHYREQDKALDDMTNYGAEQGARLMSH